MKALMVASLLFLSMMLPATAQEDSGSVWQPASAPSEEIDLKNLCVGKLSEDGASLRVIKRKLGSETRTRSVPVSKFRAETRTRVAQVNGQSVEQTYTVRVPYTEVVEVTYTVNKDIGAIPASVPLKQARAWNLDGSEVAPAELSKRLAKPTHLFVVEQDATSKFTGLNSYYASVMRDDVLVVYVPKGSLQAPR